MSSDKNVLARLFTLWASICKMIIDGKRDAERVANILQKIVDEGENLFLRQIATGILKETTGQRTLAKAKNLFTGYLDFDFTNWDTDVASSPTKETNFEVCELTKNGTLSEIYKSFGRDFNQLCWSQDQIISFIENHADKLHPQGYATFFLFKVDNEFFVAHAYRYDGGRLGARVVRLSDGFVWRAERRFRFVLPQL